MMTEIKTINGGQKADLLRKANIKQKFDKHPNLGRHFIHHNVISFLLVVKNLTKICTHLLHDIKICVKPNVVFTLHVFVTCLMKDAVSSDSSQTTIYLVESMQ